jgi:5-methylcytosine-specific restriction endonuclease McrA
MAKEWAKDFYQSNSWQKTRDYILAKNFYLCQKCHDKPAEIVHHIIWLSPSNINNPRITLGEDNLMPVCRECHAIIHEGVSSTVDGLCFNENGDLVIR